MTKFSSHLEVFFLSQKLTFSSIKLAIDKTYFFTILILFPLKLAVKHDFDFSDHR